MVVSCLPLHARLHTIGDLATATCLEYFSMFLCRCRAEALALKDAAEASELRAEAARLRTGADAMVEPHMRKNVRNLATYIYIYIFSGVWYYVLS